MKEIFRHADLARVGLYQSVLNAAGIQTFIYNTCSQQSLVAGLVTSVCTLPLFFPTLCVVDDDDYDDALTIQQTSCESAQLESGEWTCQNCGEAVPAAMDSCWNCQSPQPGT